MNMQHGVFLPKCETLQAALWSLIQGQLCFVEIISGKMNEKHDLG